MGTRRPEAIDRLIPSRHLSLDTFSAISNKSHNPSLSTKTSNHIELLAQKKKCLSFSQPVSQDNPLPVHTFAKDYDQMREKAEELRREQRKVRRVEADKILQVEDLIDDFYYNCLDCSTKGLLAFGMNISYIYGEHISGRAIFEGPTSCLKFNKQGTLLYAASDLGWVSVIDVARFTPIRSFKIHLDRIGCIENTQEWGFLTGSKDKRIIHNDIRVKQPNVLQILAHNQEVCGISLQNFNVASSGNDGKINIWDLRNKVIFNAYKFHRSAIKSLQWCPWKVDLLMAGGGANDHQMIMWNNGLQKVEKKFDAVSQVTGLCWRQTERDLVTSHGNGYGYIWNSQLKRVHTVLKGHSRRILGLTQDRINDGLWTLGSDQSLRFWKNPSKRAKVTNWKIKSECLSEFQMK